MTIPERQLATWSTQGGTTSASDTYASISAALNTPASRLRSHDIEVYLQGSYKNSTNVRGDSDVDVIAQLNESYTHDISPLDQLERERYEAQFVPASYRWAEFRADVLDALQRYYGDSAVHERNKCLNVVGSSNRLNADVVVALEHRRYTSFVSYSNEAHHSGIAFWTQRDNRRIENWPKQHYSNGVAKNSPFQTSGRYKSTARMFKNARSAAVDRGFLAEEEAPSYFVECLVYNVPTWCFGATHTDTYVTALEWLRQEDKSRFVCGSELVWLFGPTEEKWSMPAAERTIAALITLWNTW